MYIYNITVKIVITPDISVAKEAGRRLIFGILPFIDEHNIQSDLFRGVVYSFINQSKCSNKYHYIQSIQYTWIFIVRYGRVI